jgi:hypothetical protein
MYISYQSSDFPFLGFSLTPNCKAPQVRSLFMLVSPADQLLFPGLFVNDVKNIVQLAASHL